ncbi:MAG: CotH kinase family protein [Eubacteriales bacterium]
MRHSKIIIICAIITIMASSIFATILYKKIHTPEVISAYEEPLEEAPKESDPLVGLNSDFTANEEFSTHLPIVVIDTDDVPIEMPEYELLEQMSAEDALGTGEYVQGNVTIIDSDHAVNTLQDASAVVSNMIIKRRGNTSVYFEKAQYLMKFQTESGENNDVNVLGMGEHHEWILSAAMIDKSMMRNYLAFSIASQVLSYTPDSVYCEVFIKQGDTYEYQGLYLMLESIAQDVNRIDITEYAQSSVYNSYLLRRDRFNENDTMLTTYGKEYGFAAESIGVEYPTQTSISEEMIDYIQKDLWTIEEILYSDDINVFSTYPDYIDVDSFIDYFLLNEFFMNYDAGNHSTYFYKDLGGKLTMGPIWDFDGATDNYVLEAVNLEDITFQTKPWFDRLCQDEVFVKKLISRYEELRRDVLSDDAIIDKIDEIVAHNGGAIEREWYRWSEYHASEYAYYGVSISTLEPYIDEDGNLVKRNALTYEEEIYGMKSALRIHGSMMSEQLETLLGATTVSTGLSGYRDYLLVLVMILFFAPAVYIYYKK